MTTEVRAYDPERDREELWALKRAFELELGAGGGEEKESAYEGKLDPAYRERYLTWVDRCVADEDCVLVRFTLTKGSGIQPWTKSYRRCDGDRDGNTVTHTPKPPALDPRPWSTAR